MPEPTVQLVSKEWRDLAPDVEAVAARAAKACVSEANAGLTIVLADAALVRQLNRDHRGQDRPTNVLAFPAPTPLSYLGDVILSRETLLGEARAQGKIPGDHLCHLVVHGVLHLLGYDHDTDQNADEMEALEIQILKSLGVADPYAGYDGAPGPGPSGADVSGERYG